MSKDVKGFFAEKRGVGKDFFSLDWSQELGTDTIATSGSDWTVPTGLTETTPAHSIDASNRITTIWLTGGTEGAEYVLVNQITTTAGRELVGILRIKVLLSTVAAPPAYTETQLAALRAAYAQGALRVRYDGKEVEYRSLAEMEQIISTIEETISGDNLAGTKRFSLASYHRG